MDIEDAAGAAKALVRAAEVDGVDFELAEHGCAHDAGLDGDVEIALLEEGRGLRLEELADGDELAVRGALGVGLASSQ